MDHILKRTSTDNILQMLNKTGIAAVIFILIKEDKIQKDRKS